jgi:hypothetical protein
MIQWKHNPAAIISKHLSSGWVKVTPELTPDEIIAHYLCKWFETANTPRHQVDSFTRGQVVDMLNIALRRGEMGCLSSLPSPPE